MLYIKLVDSVCSHHDRAPHAPQINTPATGLIHGHNADQRFLDHH